MRLIRLLIISISFTLIAFANSFTEIKSAIKAYDFSNADALIENYLQTVTTAVDPEIYLLKFINEIGLALEVETPKYLIDNFNAVESRAYNAFDLSGNGVELTEIPLIIDSQTVAYWYKPNTGKFPTSLYNDEFYNEVYSLFNWTIESEVTSPFTQNVSDGPYYYGSNDDAAISFEFKPADSNSGQADFLFEVSNASYSSYIQIYLNGQDIGNVYNSGYSLYDKATQPLLPMEPPYANSIQVPLYLEPGDLITFEYKQYNYSDYSSEKIGIMPLNPFLFVAPENGKLYNDHKPDLGDNITIEDVLSFFLKGDAPARSLAKLLIFELDNFIAAIESWNEDSATLGQNFTGFNSNILIQKSDAIAIKSILEIIDVFASILNQYDLNIDIYDSILDEDEDFIYNTAKEFLDAYQSILSHKNTTENLIDQANAKTKLNSALTSIENILQTLWYRGSPDYFSDSYLIETSSSSDSSELEKIENQLAALKNSLNGYEKTSAITGAEMDGGASISFSPFLANDLPLNIRELAYELSDSSDRETLQTLNNYGFLKDYLPNSFDGKILVFYNFNNDLNTALLLRDNYEFDPIEGELRLDNFSYNGNSSINWDDLQISYLTRNSGSWNSDGYYNYNSGQNIGPLQGTFYFYDSLLDLNENGQPDVLDLYDLDPMYSSYNNFEKKIDYETNLNSSYIDSKQLSRYPTPQSLKGYINLVEDSDYNDSTMQSEYKIEAGYFISNDDWFEIDLGQGDGFRTRSLDIETYEIDGDIITFTETLAEHSDYYGYYDEDVSQLFFNDQFSYLSLDLEDSNYYDMGMNSEYEYDDDDIEYGVIYPAYLDLDNDGLADGEGMKAQITPNLDRLPTSSEIQTAIDKYNQGSSPSDNNGSGEPADHNDTNANALTDADGDNMPDALEIQYGGDSSDPNDAYTTLNEILSVDRYTLNEITDLRLGSTLYEVSQGIVTFNIILEESSDLVNWVQHEPMQVDLGQQPDDNSKFYRFKMAD